MKLVKKNRKQLKLDLLVSGTPAIPDPPVSRTPAIFSTVNVLQIPGILDNEISHFTSVRDTGNSHSAICDLGQRKGGRIFAY